MKIKYNINIPNHTKPKIQRELRSIESSNTLGYIGVKSEHKQYLIGYKRFGDDFVICKCEKVGNMTYTDKIWIEHEFPTLNDYINAERSNKYKAAKIKRDSTNTVMYLTMNKKQFKTPCKLKFTWYIRKPKRGRGYDYDNIAYAKKHVLDGFVKAGVIPDDSRKYIKGFQDKFIELNDIHKKVGVLVESINT